MPGAMHGGLERAAARFGDRDAVLAGDRRWTFAELDALSNAFAHHLAAAGVGPGDRVAVMTSNRVELVLAVQGASRLSAAAEQKKRLIRAHEISHLRSQFDHTLGLLSLGGDLRHINRENNRGCSLVQDRSLYRACIL